MNRLELITSKEWYEAELECRLFELGFKPKKAEKLAKKLVNKSFMRGINELADRIRTMENIIKIQRDELSKSNDVIDEQTTPHEIFKRPDNIWHNPPETPHSDRYIYDNNFKDEPVVFYYTLNPEKFGKALEERKKKAEKFMNNFKEGGLTFKNKHIKEVQNDRN